MLFTFFYKMDGLYVKLKLFSHLFVNCTNIFEKNRKITLTHVFCGLSLAYHLFRFFRVRLVQPFFSIIGDKQRNGETSQTNIYIFI